MRIQGIIFDMDGTMIDSMPYHAKSWVAFAERHRLTIEVEELLRRTTGRTGAECMEVLFGRPMDHHYAQYVPSAAFRSIRGTDFVPRHAAVDKPEFVAAGWALHRNVFGVAPLSGVARARVARQPVGMFVAGRWHYMTQLAQCFTGRRTTTCR